MCDKQKEGCQTLRIAEKEQNISKYIQFKTISYIKVALKLCFFFFSLRNHFTYSIFMVCVLFFINLGKILTVIKEKVFCSNSANKYNIHSSGGVNVVFQL